MLYSKVVEIDERIIPEWNEFIEEGKTQADNGDKLIKTSSGVIVRQLKPIGERRLYHQRIMLMSLTDMEEVAAKLQSLKDEGYRSLAVVFAHSYLLPEHEHRVAKLARSMGFDNVSVSADIEARIGLIARGQSATADAYLTPEVKRYLNGFAKGFEGRLEDSQCRVSFMQSDGALADFRKFSGLRAILCESERGLSRN